MKIYPSWRFHRELPAKIVADANEDALLGPGWSDTPADFIDAPESAETAPASSDAGIAEDPISDLLPQKPRKRGKK